VQREYKDIASGEVIKEKETFIECLTHDSFIIQIPFLSKNRKTELEALLSIFDQSMTESSRHFLELNENDYPKKYQEVIRRLVKAAAEPAVREVMTVEDEILNDFNTLERTIQKKDEVIAEKDEAIAEKDEQLIEKDEAIEQAITLLADKLNITREAAELMINVDRN
jgi:precorrin isomerase